MNIDSTGMLFEKNAGGGGGGLAYAGVGSGQIAQPTTPLIIPPIVPFIPPSTTYDIDILRKEKFDITASFSKKRKKKPNGQKTPEIPDVEYPGDDPTRAPGDDYEWQAAPNEPVGGSKGAWVNKPTGEQWHPDLNHDYPKGPHWDYTDIWGYVWSVFKDGRIILWG